METTWGLDLIRACQALRTPGVEAVCRVFHGLGSEVFYLVLLALVYWCVDVPLGRRLAVVALLSAWANNALKVACGRPRPYQIGLDLQPVLEESGNGLPSGHAQNAAATLGVLASAAGRRGVRVLVALYLVAMALSRLFLGVHYLQDVVVGLAIGLLLAWLGIRGEPRLTAWLREQPLRRQVPAVVAPVLLLLLIHPLLVTPGEDTLDTACTTLGTMLGFALGVLVEVRWVRFDPRGPWAQRVGRLLLGLATTLILRAGLSLACRHLEPEPLFRLARYTLLGVWVGAGAPWLYLRLGLAGHRPTAGRRR